MASVLLVPAGQIVNPNNPQLTLAVAPDFERFDGLDIPADHPAAVSDGSGRPGDNYGPTPRPGGLDQQTGQVYTPGPLRGVVGTVGGQPLPVSDRVHRPAGSITRVQTPQMQWRLGVGQNTSAGAQQTVQLSEITSNPPQPGDLTSIIAGLG
jgi:hypothetical protein